mgnify:CR=1 FL=1
MNFLERIDFADFGLEISKEHLPVEPVVVVVVAVGNQNNQIFFEGFPNYFFFLEKKVETIEIIK